MSRGFTLLEIIIIIAIIGTLAALVLPNLLSFRLRAQYASAIHTLRLISEKIDVYTLEHEDQPASLADIGAEQLRDPWGNPYQYLNINPVGQAKTPLGKLRKDHSLVPVNSDYDLYSLGPDGKSQSPFTAKASQDDIVRANNGSYYGLVSDY